MSTGSEFVEGEGQEVTITVPKAVEEIQEQRSIDRTFEETVMDIFSRGLWSLLEENFESSELADIVNERVKRKEK